MADKHASRRNERLAALSKSVSFRLYFGQAPEWEIERARALLRGAGCTITEIQVEGVHRPLLRIGQAEVHGYSGADEIAALIRDTK